MPTEPELEGRGVLRVEDLPDGYGWSALDVDEDFWHPDFANGITMHLCANPVSPDDHWNITAWAPFPDLGDAPHAALFSGGLQQVVYTDTPAHVRDAFQQTLNHMATCLDAVEADPGYGISDPYVTDGWHWEVERLALAPLGENVLAVRYYMADSDGASTMWEHTLAVVQTLDRLVLVEIALDPDADQGIDSAGFEKIVRTAIDRLNA